MESENGRVAEVPPPGTRWGRRLALATVSTTLVAVAWLLWGTTPVLPDGPLVARRGEDGKFKVEGTLSGSGINGRLNALKVNQNRTTASSHSTSDGTAVLARTVALFNLSDSLFGQRLGYDLFQKLQGTDRFREVRYLPHGESLPDGEPLPDLFATIEVLNLKEGGIAPSTTLDATVRVTLSDQYERSSHSVLGNLTPPSLQFRWDSTVECQAKNVGVETGSAKYAGVSEDLTKGIAKELGDYLDKQVANIGELVEPSPEFLPDYQPLEGLEFLTGLNAKRIMSGPRFMTPNVTVWRIDPPGTVGETMKALAEGLSAEGWESPDLANAESKTVFQVSSKQKPNTIECFEQQDGRFPKTGPTRVYVVSTTPMSSKDIVAGVKALAARDEPEDRLVPYSRVWHLAKDEMRQYFQRNPASLLPSILHLARQETKAGNQEEARKLVLRAAGLKQILKREAPGDELKKLGKEAGLESIPKLPDVSVLVPDNVIDLRNPASTDVRIVGKRPVILLLSAGESEQRYAVVTRSAGSANSGQVSFVLNGITLGEHGQSWTSTDAQYQRGQRRALDMISAGPAGSPRQLWITITDFDRESAQARIVAE